VFPVTDQQSIRARFAKTFRYVVSQRLMPRRDGLGKIAAFEILKSTLRTREYVHRGEGEGKSLIDAMRDGSTEGMQCFDDQLEKLVRDTTIDTETAFSYATNRGNLRLQLADLLELRSDVPSANVKVEIKPEETEEPVVAADPELETS